MDQKMLMTGVAMGFAGVLRVLITDWLDKRKARKQWQKDNPGEVIIEQFTPEFIANAPESWRKGFELGRKLGLHRHRP